MGPERGVADSHSVLVTGASSGIGLELARLFARDGHRLILVARSEAALRSLAAKLESGHGTRCEVVVADLAAADGPGRVVQQIESLGVHVDVLVNNAGFGSWGPFHEMELANQIDMIRLNVVALTELTHRLLPGMLERGRGRLMNVASTAAFQPGPLMAVYYGTKAYVLHFSEALAEELRDTAVTVTAFCPGPTQSGFQAAARMQRSRLVQQRMPDAAGVAAVGYRGMWLGRRVVIPGAANKLATMLVRVTPRRLVTAIVRRIQSA